MFFGFSQIPKESRISRSPFYLFLYSYAQYDYLNQIPSFLNPTGTRFFRKRKSLQVSLLIHNNLSKIGSVIVARLVMTKFKNHW